MFFQIVSNNLEQKHRVPDTDYINNDYVNVIKFMKITSSSTRTGRKRIKNPEEKKLVFQKNR